MKRLLAPALLTLLALPLGAAAPSDPLSFVPADATAVGMVRLSDLRSSPYAAHLFSEADHCTLDGDGARFLAEAHLKPSEDIDTIVFAGTAGADGKSGSGIAIFEGRFDAASVESALITRGATKKAVSGGSLLILPEKMEAHADGQPGAIAFLGRHLAVAGPQASVEAALAAGASRTEFRTGSGMGRHLGRVATDASAWVIVDLARAPWKDKHVNVKGDVDAGNGSRQVMQIAGVMKQVPWVTMSATIKGDGMKVAAFGACDDAETRGLLEDSLRGLLAAWRLSVQDSKPDLVPVLRSFKVEQSKDGVSLAGTVPGQALESFLAHKAGR